MEIKTGEIVHLNSGSPDLKVIRIEGEKATVEWQGDNGELKSSSIPLPCLACGNPK
jgi:hypothetical protein